MIDIDPADPASTIDAGNIIRKPQTGRIRNYVLFTTAVATAVILVMLIIGVGASESSAATLGAATP